MSLKRIFIPLLSVFLLACATAKADDKPTKRLRRVRGDSKEIRKIKDLWEIYAHMVDYAGDIVRIKFKSSGMVRQNTKEEFELVVDGFPQAVVVKLPREGADWFLKHQKRQYTNHKERGETVMHNTSTRRLYVKVTLGAVINEYGRVRREPILEAVGRKIVTRGLRRRKYFSW